MKFENIKVGDTVFTERLVRYGWSCNEIFYVPEKVTKTTKTQFTVESGDRYKKNGYQIGGSGEAYFKGDKVGFYSGRIVDDERNKLAEFRNKLQAETSFNRIAENLKIGLGSNFTLSEVNEMLDKLKEIEMSISVKGQNITIA